jgi:hypothetical protein
MRIARLFGLFVLFYLAVPVLADVKVSLDSEDYVRSGERIEAIVHFENLENATNFEINLGYPNNFSYLYVKEWDNCEFVTREKHFGKEGLYWLEITAECDKKINGSRNLKVVFKAYCDEPECYTNFELGRVHVNDERADVEDDYFEVYVFNPQAVIPTPPPELPSTPPPTPPPTPTPELYVVVVNSNPTGARVYIDGELKGTTPVILRLKQGTYGLKVQKDGYRAEVDVLKVNTDVTKNYNLEKEKEETATRVVAGAKNPPVNPTPPPATKPTKTDYSWIGWLIGLAILGGLVYMFRKTRSETIEENITYIVGDDPHEWTERRTMFDGGIAYDKMKGMAFLVRAGRPVIIKRQDGTTETVWLVDGKTGAGIILERGELLEGKTIDIDGVDEEGKPTTIKFKLNTNPKMISDVLSANLLREMAKLKPSMGQVILALFGGLLIGYLFGLIF